MVFLNNYFYVCSYQLLRFKNVVFDQTRYRQKMTSYFYLLFLSLQHVQIFIYYFLFIHTLTCHQLLQIFFKFRNLCAHDIKIQRQQVGHQSHIDKSRQTMCRNIINNEKNKIKQIQQCFQWFINITIIESELLVSFTNLNYLCDIYYQLPNFFEVGSTIRQMRFQNQSFVIYFNEQYIQQMNLYFRIFWKRGEKKRKYFCVIIFTFHEKFWEEICFCCKGCNMCLQLQEHNFVMQNLIIYNILKKRLNKKDQK
eukprot:TRINITY_DN23107_c0_g1_i2.p1 TRINITY_DN23107_c0_g1~~TRINITY_DN23107_c0_g1_i2.p1  ORF type:complete len:253 (-),score=-10.66 TRINITY_DN23107_c0_g1_i2:73-831(-)